MCYNCGCFNPTDDMGHADNITEDTLKRLAGDQDVNEFKKQLLLKLDENKLDPEAEAEFSKAAKAGGQSVDEAKRNARELLKTQI